MNFTKLLGTKTFWLALGGIVTAGSSYFQGVTTGKETIAAVFTGLLGIFLRDGIITGTSNN